MSGKLELRRVACLGHVCYEAWSVTSLDAVALGWAGGHLFQRHALGTCIRTCNSNVENITSALIDTVELASSND